MKYTITYEFWGFPRSYTTSVLFDLISKLTALDEDDNVVKETIRVSTDQAK